MTGVSGLADTLDCSTNAENVIFNLANSMNNTVYSKYNTNAEKKLQVCMVHTRK
jgi:hypothetical protein